MGLTGVTTWIKRDVCKGVPFRRKAHIRGQGAVDGLKVGRRIDTAFKQFCTGQKVTTKCVNTTLRLQNIKKVMTAAGLTPVAANTFVTHNNLKTHCDAIATDRAGRKIVIELKSTQGTMEFHRSIYNSLCVNLPTTRFGNNTEALHHKLQAAFGAVAACADSAVVIMVCHDDAVLYPVSKTLFSPGSFVMRPNVQLTDPIVAGGWPAAASAAFPRLSVRRSKCGKFGRLQKGKGVAIALQAPPSACPRPALAAAKRLLYTREGPHYFAFPRGGTWSSLLLTEPQ